MNVAVPNIEHALALHRAGRLDEAAEAYRAILGAQPDHADAMHLLGVILLQRKEVDVALEQIESAVALQPNNAIFLSNLGAGYNTAGQTDRAIQVLQKAVAAQPGYVEAHNNLGHALINVGRHQEAAAQYQQTLKTDPEHESALRGMADAMGALGRYDVVAQCCHQLLKKNPNDGVILMNLGKALRHVGRPADAIQAFDRAIQRRPDLRDAYSGLGEACSDVGRFDLAVAAYEKLVAIAPDYAAAHNGLAVALRKSSRPNDAIASYHRAIELDPNFGRAHSNLGVALKTQGRLAEALEHYRKADELEPTIIHLSNLLFSSNYDPEITPEALFDLHKRWLERYGSPDDAIADHPNKRDPERRLRLGYVSGDFKKHPAARFVEALFAAHDPAAFELYAYFTHADEDEVTQRLRLQCAGWRRTKHLTDSAMSDLIRRDGIDVLVDLSGHSAGHRLTMFATRPAPVQISWLGYPNTSAVAAMDYYIGDTITDPETDPVLYVETLLRMKDHSFAAFHPPPDAPPVAPLPAKQAGRVAFGSLLDMAKITPPVLELWRDVVLATPNAHLYIFRSTLHGETGERLKKRIVDAGLSEDRFTVEWSVDPADGWLSVYRNVDVALDSFPWSGHTTACEALWQGVPVLTWSGNRHAARMVASVMTHLGLPEFIADSKEDFITKGKALAERIDWLADLRQNLRARMLASPLCDASGFAAEIEPLYREAWRNWCGK